MEKKLKRLIVEGIPVRKKNLRDKHAQIEYAREEERMKNTKNMYKEGISFQISGRTVVIHFQKLNPFMRQ